MTVIDGQDQTAQPQDPEQAVAFAGTVAGELGAAAGIAMAVLGQRLGLYHALEVAGPCQASELAARVGLAERYVREWLNSQAAGGWIAYEEETERYELSTAQAAVLVDEHSPMYLGPSIQLLNALYASIDGLERTFRSGEGISWGQQHPDLHQAVSRFSASAFSPMLPTWLAHTGEAAARLANGGRALELGCGQGSVLLALGAAFPTARIDGVDAHAESVEAARQNIARAGLASRVRAHVAEAAQLPAEAVGPYDVVLMVDCLHDMGDPVAAAQAAREALGPDGAVLIVEPASSDRVAENFNPVGRYYYAVSTAFCMPSALSQAGGWALGNQGGPSRVIEICRRAGLSSVETLDPTPFNMVFVARR